MYKKLLSNLPFNPSLIGQVSFYANRLKKEESLRRFGMFFMAFSLVLQLFAVIVQPEPTLASSRNDIIPGGFSSKSQAVDHCKNNRYNFRDTLEHFGVSCDALESSSKKSIRSTSYDKKLLSLGRLPYGKAGERQVKIAGKTYYQRYLWAWDSFAYSTYDALVGTRSNGEPFMVLYSCGNVTVVEAPEPTVDPEPTFTPGNAICSGLDARRLSRTSYRFTAQTAGADFVVRGYLFDFGDGNESRNTSRLFRASADHTYSRPGTYTAKATIDVTVQERTSAVERTVSCETIVTVAEVPRPTPTPTPEPEELTPTGPIDACPDIPGTQTDEDECSPCDESSSQDDITACLVLSKSANNVTQSIAEANGTTAKPGDTIQYTLNTRNSAVVPIEQYVVEEHVGDLLEYALITDFHGGSMDENGIVRWPAQDLGPGATLKQQLTIQIKEEIPETPVATSNPGSFDLVMTNVYGNTVEIQIPASPAKVTEQIVRTLPNTGPGQGLIISTLTTTFIGFFFARSILYRKEINIVKHSHSLGGAA